MTFYQFRRLSGQRHDPCFVAFSVYSQRHSVVGNIVDPHSGQLCKSYAARIKQQHYQRVALFDGIAPGPATMRDRTYPLTTEVYAIIRSDLDPDSMAYRLYEWLQSDSSNAVLEECGFLPN